MAKKICCSVYWIYKNLPHLFDRCKKHRVLGSVDLVVLIRVEIGQYQVTLLRRIQWFDIRVRKSIVSFSNGRFLGMAEIEECEPGTVAVLDENRIVVYAANKVKRN